MSKQQVPEQRGGGCRTPIMGIDAIRSIRDEIDTRVRALLAELVPSTDTVS